MSLLQYKPRTVYTQYKLKKTMANSEDIQFLINTNWPSYLENIVVCLDKKCLGLSNYKWGHYINPEYIRLTESDIRELSNNFNIGYIYCKTNLFLRFRFTVMWQNELRIIVDTLKCGEATSFEEYTNLASVPTNIQRNNTNAFKTTKLNKKANLLANDVISLLVPGENVIKVTKHQIEEYETKKLSLVVNINKLKTELNLNEDYLRENFQEHNSRIYLRHVGYVDLLKLNLCKISSDLYIPIDIMILLIKMMDKEAQESGKSARDRYYN